MQQRAHIDRDPVLKKNKNTTAAAATTTNDGNTSGERGRVMHLSDAMFVSCSSVPTLIEIPYFPPYDSLSRGSKNILASFKTDLKQGKIKR